MSVRRRIPCASQHVPPIAAVCGLRQEPQALVINQELTITKQHLTIVIRPTPAPAFNNHIIRRGWGGGSSGSRIEWTPGAGRPACTSKHPGADVQRARLEHGRKTHLRTSEQPCTGRSMHAPHPASTPFSCVCFFFSENHPPLRDRHNGTANMLEKYRSLPSLSRHRRASACLPDASSRGSQFKLLCTASAPESNVR